MPGSTDFTKICRQFLFRWYRHQDYNWSYLLHKPGPIDTLRNTILGLSCPREHFGSYFFTPYCINNGLECFDNFVLHRVGPIGFIKVVVFWGMGELYRSHRKPYGPPVQLWTWWCHGKGQDVQKNVLYCVAYVDFYQMLRLT